MWRLPMSLKNTIQSAVQSALSAIGDLGDVVTYQPKSGAGHVQLKGLFSGFKSYEVGQSQGFIQSGDQKLLIPGLDLKGIVPATGDELLRADGSRWTVVHYDSDASQASFELHVRRA